MWKAAKLSNDIGVELSPFQCLCVTHGAEQRHTPFLVGQRLRMLKRQVKELPVALRQCAVKTVGDGAVGNLARQWIGGEGARGATKDVTGKLVEENGERKRALGCVLPFRQRFGGGRFVGGKKTRANGVVEGGVLRKPLLGSGPMPERQHCFRRLDHNRISPFSTR